MGACTSASSNVDVCHGDPFIRLGALEYTQQTQQTQLLLLHQHLEILTHKVRDQVNVVEHEFAELYATSMTQQQRFIADRVDKAVKQVVDTLNP